MLPKTHQVKLSQSFPVSVLIFYAALLSSLRLTGPLNVVSIPYQQRTFYLTSTLPLKRNINSVTLNGQYRQAIGFIAHMQAATSGYHLKTSILN